MNFYQIAKAHGELMQLLNALGYRLWLSPGEAEGLLAGEETTGLCYERLVAEDRKVNVQIHPDGRHRASHWIRESETCWRSDTVPTTFATARGMALAIKYETERTEHPSDRGPVAERDL